MGREGREREAGFVSAPGAFHAIDISTMAGFQLSEQDDCMWMYRMDG